MQHPTPAIEPVFFMALAILFRALRSPAAYSRLGVMTGRLRGAFQLTRHHTTQETSMPRLFAALLLALTPMLASAEEVIRVYNWNDYIAPQVLKDFEAETGIRVDYHTNSKEEELAGVLATGEAIDVAVPSHDALPAMIKNGTLQPLDFSLLPNRKHLDKQLLSTLVALDRSEEHTSEL